jgi:hypothetical protein
MTVEAAGAARFFGWRVVAGAFLLATIGWGLGFYGPPVFLHALHEARGWPVALVSAAVTTHFLIGAVVVANLPALHRRFGIPAVTKTGAILLAIGIAGWALATSPWMLFVATLASGAGWVCLGAAAINAIVAPWFVSGRPRALSTAYNGASIGGVIFSPLWVAAIGALGFPMAAVLVGTAVVIVVWVLADRYFASTPEALGQNADGASTATELQANPFPSASGRALWRNRSFLTLALAMALGLFAQIGLIAHLFSLLVPVFGPGRAGIAMGLATATAILGRSLVGWLMPAGADRRIVASLGYGVQIAGSVALICAGDSAILLLAGVLLFGLNIGNATSLPPLIAQAEFAREEVSRVVALIVACGQATYAFAPAAFGILRDVSGSGSAVFVAALIVQALAITAFLAGRRPQ